MKRVQLPGSAPFIRALAYVRVGGGPSVPVVVDTGSAGLRMLPQAIGPQTKMTSRIVGERFGTGYGFVGHRAVASVTIGSVTTRYPIGIQMIQGVVCRPGLKCDAAAKRGILAGLVGGSGAKGLLGIDTTNAFGSNIYSPLLQLAEPYSDGFFLRLAPQGSGTLTVGAPPSGPGTVTERLAPSNPRRYRTGAPAYQRNVIACWTVGPARTCGSTDFDIGTPTTFVPPVAARGNRVGVIRGIGRVLAPGTSVSLHTRAGAAIWQFTSNTNYGNGLTQVSPGAGGLNTGIPPFFTHTIGWNMKTGQIVISPS